MSVGDGPELRVAFFGTPAFAVPTLEHLLLSHHQVVGVVTQPDRPRGRGQQRSESPVKQVGLAHGLAVLQPSRMKGDEFAELMDAVRAWNADIGVVAAYGHVMPEALLELPRLGMVTVHASLLPKYRGAAPIQRAVMAGEQETGITIIRLIRELDAGPMLGALAVPIDAEGTSQEVEHELAFLGATLLVGVLSDLAAGTSVETAQDESRASYAARLTRADGLIDWSQTARRIHDQVRGLHPWPHAFTYLGEARYIVLQSRVEAAFGEPAGVGQVVEASGDRLVVGCGGDEVLAITEIQAEGRRAQTVREFLSGHRIRAGQLFTGSGPEP